MLFYTKESASVVFSFKLLLGVPVPTGGLKDFHKIQSSWKFKQYCTVGYLCTLCVSAMYCTVDFKTVKKNFEREKYDYT